MALKILNIQELLQGTEYEDRAEAIASHIKQGRMDNDVSIHNIPTLQTVGGQPAILVLQVILQQMKRQDEAPPQEPQATATEEKEVDASEAARELAAEHDVDLTKIHGSGKSGAVIKADVLNVIYEEDDNDDQDSG